MSPERRQYARFRTRIRATCALVSGQIPSFRARVLDISQGGVQLLVKPPLHVGDLLRIRLSRVVEGRVVHATPTQTGKWVVGCAFKGGISESAVRDLVEKPGR
jgi:c-di-GMP-binding flagellar brake protein YcgR